jgi:argininosuccinate lyase
VIAWKGGSEIRGPAPVPSVALVKQDSLNWAIHLSIQYLKPYQAIPLTDSPSRSGVFAASTDKRLESFSESISFDHRLFRHDIRGSIAHARMLAKQGLLEEHEFTQIETVLREIEVEIAEGAMQFRPELEDIHMHIESALIERLGDVGRKLHTARSRNDQVNTDFRLWIRDALDDLDGLLHELQRAFLGRCDKDRDVIVPAYTHLQRAQPVLAAHYWLCYIEKYQRDRERLADCRHRVNVCGLGAAACAGTTLPIDREMTARELGFARVAGNSLDVSSDRDFVLESAFVLAMIAEHLSGWAEEWILWSTVEFNMLKLPHQFCTGSSIMPQKINPDTLELTRGKSARVLGNLQTLLILVKGLPLAYNRDLQEDKPPLFDSFDTVRACLELAIPIVQGAELRREAILARLDKGYLDATTLMEHLILLGIPQRTAHHLVGKLVGMAQESDISLAELSDEQLQSTHPLLDGTAREVLGVEKAVKAYQSYGSSQPSQIEHQLKRWREQLQ